MYIVMALILSVCQWLGIPTQTDSKGTAQTYQSTTGVVD